MKNVKMYVKIRCVLLILWNMISIGASCIISLNASEKGNNNCLQQCVFIDNSYSVNLKPRINYVCTLHLTQIIPYIFVKIGNSIFRAVPEILFSIAYLGSKRFTANWGNVISSSSWWIKNFLSTEICLCRNMLHPHCLDFWPIKMIRRFLPIPSIW